ncbi:MAG TPA: protein kinase [Candidatus Solibacter sp.]|nr:protein kinase [Candidatus Solibacter sp.]
MGLSAGSKVGPYEILSLLGAGGMGEVYRARDSALGRDVAVKILPTAFSADADRLRRFKQEAQAAAALNHPNILTIYHIGEQDGAPYIASELLEGESLRQRLQAGPLPVRKAVDYAIQMARGLAAAHDKGIVHRDLKPENIFLTKDGRAKILDFGLAKLTRPEQDGSGPDSQTLTGRSEPGFVLGTVGYMSPEQVRGHVAGPASDLFSFGAVLYEILTGRRAFRGDTAADTMSAILKEDPPEMLEADRQVPPALERIVRHCLEKNPEERFQSARDVAFALESLSSASSSATSATSSLSTALATAAATSAGSRGKSKLAIYAVAGAGLALALVAAGVWFGGRNKVAKPNYHRLTFRRGTVQSARFAPDGQTVVYSASWDGKPPDVFTTRPQGPESRSLGMKGSTLLSVSETGELAVLGGAHTVEPVYYRGTLGRVPLEGGAPREIMANIQNAEWSPDGTGLLIIHQVSGLDHMEFPAGKLIAQGGALNFPRFSPKGDRVAFVEFPTHFNLEGSVDLVDMDGHKTVLSKGWADLTGLAWSADGKEIWFTGDHDNGSAGLFAVDLQGHERLVEKIPGDLILYDVAADGRVLFGREEWRGEIYGLGPGDAAERDLSWFDFSSAQNISADGKYLLFAEEGESSGGVVSYFRSMDGTSVVRLYDGPCWAFTQDVQHAICVGQDDQLHDVPTRSGETTSFGHDNLIYLVAAWLPGEKQLVTTAQERGHGRRLYIVDRDGGKVRPVGPEGVGNYFSISNDGSLIAVLVGADYQTYVVPVAGGDAKAVPGLEPGWLPIAWSPNNRYLYCARIGEVPAHIRRVEVASGKSEEWKRLMPPDPVGITYITDIHFSSDMKSYVYDVQRRLDVLYVVEGLR